MVKNREKNPIEFFELLIKLTQKNIDFIKKKEVENNLCVEKYFNEIKRIQDLINSFDFMGLQINNSSGSK